MAVALEYKDENSGGETIQQSTIRLVSNRVTAREIITQRVQQEVETFNASSTHSIFRGLVQPTDTETQLNGYKLRTRKNIDVTQQVARALRGFETNSFFMLFDEIQVESLEQSLLVKHDSTVSFMKLVPLVGG